MEKSTNVKKCMWVYVDNSKRAIKKKLAKKAIIRVLSKAASATA